MDNDASATDVAQWIREQIRTGAMVAGQRLVEIDIMGPTRASRARVRSALQRMEAEGLVIIEEFRGASVRRFSNDDLRHIYRVRQALEGVAAHDFALAVNPDGRAELVALQADMDRCGVGDYLSFARLNDAWHDCIVRGSGNPHLVASAERLKVPIHRLLLASFMSGERIATANGDHQRSTAAIIAGEAYAAEQLMRAHIAAGLNSMLDSLDQGRATKA